MGQTAKGLKNVQSFEKVFSSQNLPISLFVVFNITSKRLKDNLSKILSYEGTGELKVPGSVLSSITSITNLAIGEVSDLLGISKSTYYRVIEGSLLDMKIVDKLSAILKIYQRGLEAFDGDEKEFEDWLDTKIPTLNNQKPRELLKSESGRQLVLDTIDRIEHNVYG